MLAPFHDRLYKAGKEGLLRNPRLVESAQGRSVIIDGREVILFCSNNYLGFANHPDVITAAKESIDRDGWGSGASRLVSGTMPAHRDLEDMAASFLDKEASLLYSSGYAANVGVITALMERGDLIVADKLCHASIIDGARWSGARLKRYAHCDPNSLEDILKKSDGAGSSARKGNVLIVTDGLFSMDGDIAPLREIAQLAKSHGAWLMVDDAHGVGIFGRQGRGTPNALGVSELVDIHIITLGKALGGSGGIAAGSRELIDGLVNFSRSFIYSTAPPPPMAAAGLKALELVRGQEGASRRANLFMNILSITRSLDKLGLDISEGESQIIPIMADRLKDPLAATQRLLDLGVFVPLIRPPTVPKGTSRFRLSIMSDHTKEDIDKMVSAFAELFG